MKKIAIFLELPGAKDYPLSKDDYFRSYQELAHEVENLGDECYIVRGQSSYEGTGTFSNSWQYRNGDLVETGRIHADVIFDRGNLMHDESVPTMNGLYINEICTNKWKTYELFKAYSPLSFLANNKQELQDALKKVKTEIKVVKPIDGQEGEGVAIGLTEDVLSKQHVFPVIVQEFIDSRAGLPGICEGIHDFRVVMLNGEFAYSYYRTPPQGKYTANVAQGGSFETLSRDRIPKKMMELVAVVVKAFADHTPSLYTVDAAFENAEPKMIELNSRPGLLENAIHPVYVELKKKLAQVLHSM